jgi:ATP-dependent protease HslVU (ClpYQ) peptidase subunit
MSIVCAAIKGNEVAIAADTQMSFGSMAVGADNLKNCGKLYAVKDSVIGLVGWAAVSSAMGHLIEEEGQMFSLDERSQIYKTFLKLHDVLKKDYYLNPYEDSDQPLESSQIYALIINKYGLFEVCRFREVCEYRKYWAIGSGSEYALGAIQAMYESEATAQQLVEAGVSAAAAFDKGCALPATSEVLQLQSRDNKVTVLQG